MIKEIIQEYAGIIVSVLIAVILVLGVILSNAQDGGQTVSTDLDGAQTKLQQADITIN